MARKNKEGLHKHTFYLFEGDVEELKILCPEVSVATVIRTLVRTFIIQSRKAAEKNEPLEKIEVDL